MKLQATLAALTLLAAGTVVATTSGARAADPAPDPSACAQQNTVGTCPSDPGGYSSGPAGTTYTFKGPDVNPTHQQCGENGCIGESDAWYVESGGGYLAAPADCPTNGDSTTCHFTTQAVVTQDTYTHLHVEHHFGISPDGPTKDFWVFERANTFDVTAEAHDASDRDVTQAMAYDAGRAGFFWVRPGADPTVGECPNDESVADFTTPPACMHSSGGSGSIKEGQPSWGPYDLILPSGYVYNADHVRSAYSTWTTASVTFDARKTVVLRPKGTSPSPSPSARTTSAAPSPSPSPSASPTVAGCESTCLPVPTVVSARLDKHPVKQKTKPHPGKVKVRGTGAAGDTYVLHLLSASSCSKGVLKGKVKEIKAVTVHLDAHGRWSTTAALKKLALKQGIAAFVTSATDSSHRSRCLSVS